MKPRAQRIFATLILATGLAACDKHDKVEPRFTPPQPEEKPPKTERTVRANETAKQAALDRLAVMQEITKALKPLREPEAALAKEPELKALFDQYFQHTATAADEGIEGRLLAALSAHLAPDDWGDARQEFHRYILLVKQLCPAQRDMMNRLMREGGETQTAPEDDSPGK